MALDNLISVTFSEEDVKKLKQAITQINEVLAGKAVNLTPEERRQYGSIADSNKLLVDKCRNYMESNPATLPRTIDKTEFDADYKARTVIETPLRDLIQVVEKLKDTKTLLDHDNYQAALSYYKYVKYLASESEPGTTSIYQDLKKHYQGKRKSVQKPDESEGNPTPEV